MKNPVRIPNGLKVLLATFALGQTLAFGTEEILANGWKLQSDTPFAAVDPANDTITVTRQGYRFENAAVQPTAHDDTLRLMSKLREPYPNGDTVIDTLVAVSDYVYEADAVSNGITNSSTLQYPLPLMTWVSEPWQFVTDDTITLRLFCAHAYARNGTPVAAVEFIVTDGINSTSSLVGNLTEYQNPVTEYFIPVYEATLDISNLSDGQISADAIVYPHVGEAFQISVNGEAWPSYRPQVVQKHYQNSDGTLPVYYAYVDAVNGSSGGAEAVATSLLNSKTTSFSNFNEAAAALEVAGGGDASAALIVLKEGQDHIMSPGLDSISITEYPIRIRAEDEQANIIDYGSGNSNYVFTRARWENIRFINTGGGGVFTNRASGPDRFHVFSGCDFDANGQTESTGYFNDIGVCYFHDCTTNWSNGFARVDRSKKMSWHVHGSKGFANTFVHSVTGSYCNGQLRAKNTDDTDSPTHMGSIFAYNVIETNGGTNNIKMDGYLCGPEGVAAVGNVGAITGSSSDDNSEFFGSAPEIAQNVVWMQNTWAGASHNGPRHNKGDTTNGDIRVFVRGNIFRSRAAPGDYNKSNTWTDPGPSPRVDNWPSRFGVGERYNYTYDPGNTVNFGYGATDDADVPSWGSFYGGIEEADFPGFINDASAGGTNDHIGGDYHLVNDVDGPNQFAKVPKLPGKECAYNLDIHGAPILLDGSAIAGALQPHENLLETLDPNGDYDGDSLNSLLEYALGTDATRTTSPNELLSVSPATSTPVSGNPHYLVVRHNQRKELDGVSIQLLSSSNLVTWVDAEISPQFIEDLGETETYEWRYPLDTAKKAFLKLEVDQQITE